MFKNVFGDKPGRGDKNEAKDAASQPLASDPDTGVNTSSDEGFRTPDFSYADNRSSELPSFEDYEANLQNSPAAQAKNYDTADADLPPVYPTEPSPDFQGQTGPDPDNRRDKGSKNSGKIQVDSADKPKKMSFKEKAARAGWSISRPWKVAGTVITCILLVFSIIGIIATVGWFQRLFGRMDTPEEAGKTLIQTLTKEDFQSYQKLLASDQVNANDKALYETIRQGIDKDKEFLVSNYILIRLENGKQYLCSIYFDDHRGEYVIRSLQEVPAQMQSIFIS